MNINLLSDISDKNEKNIETKDIFKNLFLQKIYPKKGTRNLNQEIYLKEKIIYNIKKNIESQILIKKENQDILIPNSQQKQNKIPKLKSKIALKKKKNESILNKKIKINSLALLALNKKINSNYMNKAKNRRLSAGINCILSSFNDIVKNEYKKIKFNNNNKRRDKKYFTQNIINKSFTPIFNSNLSKNDASFNNLTNNSDNKNNNIFSKIYYNIKRNKNGKAFKRDISWNKNFISNSSRKHEVINENNISHKHLFFSFLDRNKNDLLFSNRTTRNKRNNFPENNNIIYNSYSKNNMNNHYLSNYSDKKNITNINQKSMSSRNNGFYSNETNNSNNDIMNFITKNKINNKYPLKINEYILNSEESKKSKKYKLKYDSDLFKKIKPNIVNIIKMKNGNNYKKLSNKFKDYFYKKVKSLKNITKSCNTELLKLININNKEIEDSNEYNKNKKDNVKKILDIRNDILDNNSIEESNKEKKYKNNALINDKNIKINISKMKDKNTMNILKKKINIISDNLALDMLENCLDIKKNVEFNIDELFNEHIKKKNEIKRNNIKEIRKKAEKNYFKIVKLRHALSGSKLFNSSLTNNKENKD